MPEDEDVVEPHHLNALDKTISDRGFFERLLREREKFDEERDRRLDERFEAQERANELKAEELARRLEVLNHAHEQAREKERDFISRETYETFVLRYQDAHQAVKNEITAAAKAENEKLETAVARVDEKFNEYIKRYEARQREVDILLAAQKGAAEEAKRAVEEQARKANRNLGVASLALGVVVFLANVIPLLVK